MRAEAPSLLRLAGPIILSQLSVVALNTTDTLMVGPLGRDALAAVGLASGLHMVVIILCTGTLLGMSPLVAQAWGAGDAVRGQRVWAQGWWLAGAISIPAAWVNWYGEEVALLLGQEPALAAAAGAYMRALAPGILPFLLFFAARQYLEAIGEVRVPMLISGAALIVNVIANRALIYGLPGWVSPLGVPGSGWATTLVRWSMLLGVGAYLFRHFRRGRPPLRPDWTLLGRIVAIGGPAALQLGAEVGFFSGCAVLMGWLGPLELGTHQITINIASTTFMVALGLSLAGSIQVGHRIGAGDQAGARTAAALTYLLVFLLMGAFALLFLVAPRVLLRLYTGDPGMLALGATLLGIGALFQLFDGAQVAAISVLRGAADTRVPTLVTTLAYWGIGVPAAWALAFPVGMGAAGVWTGIVIALAVAALLLGWRVRRVLWQGA